MARLEQLHEPERSFLANLQCPEFDTTPWVAGPPLSQRRVAIISTAGLSVLGDRPFTIMPGDHYRIIPGDVAADKLAMSHISTNFDRTGFQQDINVVFPIDRLRELAADGVVGSVAAYHYSFMGGNSPLPMEGAARELSGILKGDNVNAVVLVPV